MFAPRFFTPRYFAARHFPPDFDQVVEPQPPTGGGGGGVGLPGENYYNQKPPVIKDKEMYLDQALMEDEELLIFLKAFAEVVRWH